MSRTLRWLVVPCLLLACAGPALSQGKTAPDFPPGMFADGRSYSLEDMKGRVVALYFFEYS
jgi:hypothetical protein